MVRPILVQAQTVMSAVLTDPDPSASAAGVQGCSGARLLPGRLPSQRGLHLLLPVHQEQTQFAGRRLGGGGGSSAGAITAATEERDRQEV